jgi:hypothetical protein
MDLKLNNFTQVSYTVVTLYEDNHKAYSVATTDCSVANDYIDKLKRGLFGPCIFGRVKEIHMIRRTTEVKEESMFISKF